MNEITQNRERAPANAAGCRASFVEIETDKGHDAFFLDEPQFDATLRGFFDATAQARGLK